MSRHFLLTPSALTGTRTDRIYPTVLSTSFGKTLFIRSFIPNGKKILMIDSSLSETICRFCSCALFSNSYLKINFYGPNGSDLCNFYTGIWGNLLLDSIFCFSSITKTCLYNFDPLKPHFYIVKLGFTGVYIIFLFFCSKT